MRGQMMREGQGPLAQSQCTADITPVADRVPHVSCAYCCSCCVSLDRALGILIVTDCRTSYGYMSSCMYGIEVLFAQASAWREAGMLFTAKDHLIIIISTNTFRTESVCACTLE